MRFEIKNRSEFKVKFMVEVVRKGLSCFFKACCILVDGTGYKIAVSLAVEKQFISGDLHKKMRYRLCSGPDLPLRSIL